MPKLKTLYICQQCGQQSIKWAGRCPSCGAWNAMVEEVVEATSAMSSPTLDIVTPTALADVSLDDAVRVRTGLGEFDRVLGGGLVPGSVTLVGGEPGIGKSTLLLSMAGSLATAGCSVLYVSGEESLRQTKLRATRLGLSSSTVQLLAHTQLEVVIESIKQLKPQVVIVDSIQVTETAELSSAPGSIGQVRACAHALVRLVKESRSALFLVGPLTKEGFLAGPKVLERRVGLHQLTQQDVFVSSLGGVRLLEPAADLSMAIAIASSLKERPSRRTDLAIGEVGLTGEVRPVTNVSQRLHEAKRVGFQRCFVAAGRGGTTSVEGIEVVAVRHVRDAITQALE